MKKKLLTALLCISLAGQGIMVSAADFTSGNQESVETSRTAQGENNSDQQDDVQVDLADEDSPNGETMQESENTQINVEPAENLIVDQENDVNGVNLQAGSMGNEEVSVFSDGMSDNAPLAAGDGERQEIAGGEVTDTMDWVLYDDGELVISGSGEMEFYGVAPWNTQKNRIINVSIEEGITNNIMLLKMLFNIPDCFYALCIKSIIPGVLEIGYEEIGKLTSVNFQKEGDG